MNGRKRVLVTGASGFIGSHTLQPLLDRGYEVHVASFDDGRTGDASLKDVHRHPVDLLDQAATQALLESIRPSHLLHLAWIVEPGELIGSPKNLDWVVASIGLVRSFRDCGGERVVCCGSCYEYDWRYGYCNEELTPTSPDTLYGSAKNGLRQILESYAVNSNMGFGWGRVFFLYGPRENPRRLVSSVIRALLAGEEAKSSHGLQIRDYMHVQDVASGLVALLDSDHDGAVNIASGEAIRIRDIVEMIGQEVGRPDLVKIGVLPARSNDAPLVVADTTKAITGIGFSPEYDLRNGIRRTIEWWRDNS